MSDAAWSPAQRGNRLRVDVGEVLVDSKAALAAVLQATPGWGQVSRRRRPVAKTPPPPLPPLLATLTIALPPCLLPCRTLLQPLWWST